MKKYISWKISAGIFLLVFFGTSLMINGTIDDVDMVKQRMMSLGFLECEIDFQRGGSYSIRVNAYEQRSQALSLKGVFRPFEVRAKYIYGSLYLAKTEIEKAGFSVHEEYLPRGVKIARTGMETQSPQWQTTAMDPHIPRIERALEKTRRNRNKVHAKCKEVVAKLNQSFAPVFPDVCKTPSPSGPIPIPYPNVSKSSDMAKGSKKVKADNAEAIAKQSNYKKSESDEVGTRAKNLQNAYRRIIGKRELRADEEAEFKRELKTCLDKAALLRKTLDAYVEEIEKLLQQAQQ